SGSPDPRRGDGHERGTKEASKVFDRASAAWPPKLTNKQFAELYDILEESQPWTPRTIHALIEERYGVTYDPAHLSRKLRKSGMYYAKPRPMDPRSPENAEEILAERLGEELGEKDVEEQEADPVVLRFFR